MSDVIVNEGSKEKLRNKVYGKKKKKIKWLRDGIVIKKYEEFKMINEGENVVMIIDKKYEED